MDDLERAILCGIDPRESNEAKAKAAHFCEQFINNPESWKYSIQKIFTTENIDVKFFCLNTCQRFLQQRYATLSEQDKKLLRDAFLNYINNYIPQHNEESAIKGKYAQVLVTFFRYEYPTNWPSFFHDLFGTLTKGPAVIETYLVILDTIDELVVSHDLDYSEQNRAQNTLIKDYMRQDCVVKLATTWFDILTHLQSHPRICKLALQNISKYVSWIDINLIVNDLFLSLIFRLLSNESLRGGAAKCLEQIVSKGMDFRSKQELLVKLRLQEIIPKLHDDDIDFQAKLAKLINSIGLESIACRSDAHKINAPPPIIQNAEALVESSLKISLAFLGHEYDDVSQSVIPFIQTYLYKLRHTNQLNEQTLGSLLQILTKKLKYDDEYNFDKEDDEEVQFQDFRKELEKSVKNILRLAPSLAYSFIKSLIFTTIIEGDCTLKQMKDVEVALRVFYIAIESLTDKSSEPFFSEVINSLLLTRVLQHEHPTVSLLLYEVIVRYQNFVNDTEQYTTLLLMFFLGDKGIRHPLPRVRGRACYMFLRFLTSIKNRHLPFTRQIMDSLTPLLKKDINEKAQALLDDDQQHIFEAAGFLAYSVHSDSSLHQSIIDVVITELFKAMKTILQNELYKMDTQENPQYSLFLSRSIHSIGSFSKPFKTCTKEISPYFHSALDLVLEAWMKITQLNVDLRAKIMFFFHRMVECLDKAILPALPNLLNVLFTTPCLLPDLLNSIRLLNQLISRFKGELKGLIEKILSPVVNRLFDLIAKTDDIADKREIHRHYLQFIQNIVTYKLSSSLISDENKGNLMFILNMILESCNVESHNLKNLKACVVLLGDITNEWTGKVQGYDQYFLTSVLPMFIFVLSKLNFRDAESLSIASSICSMQRKYSKSVGQPFLDHLAAILNKLGNPEFTNSYLLHLTNDPNDKSFLSSISGLFSNLNK